MRIQVVGIGVSAGDLEGLKLLLAHLPAGTGLAFVIVPHLDPRHHSNLSEVSAVPVQQVTDGLEIKPNHLYVIQQDSTLELANQVLRITPRALASSGPHTPIDHFFRSLARECGSRAIGVILSGAGADGAAGLETVKAAGGVTFVQDPATAKFVSMPQAAIGRGSVDFVMSPEAIAAGLTRLGHYPYIAEDDDTGSLQRTAATKDQFDPILTVLRDATGIDFTLYRENTVQRCILRRLALHNICRLEEYRTHLENDPPELSALHRDLLISVTCFFRDPESFENLKKLVFPRLVQDRPADAVIRIWVAGCATGEEAYSIAILFQEYFGEANHVYPVQIFASDISAREIYEARSGKFAATIARGVTPERLNRYFSKVKGGYQISRAVRDMCVFSKHDLTKDPPFSRLDLISCQNVLTFFGSVRKNVIALFHYALKPGGFLVLGPSETESSDLLSTVEGANSIYTKNEIVGKRHPFYPGTVGTRRSADTYTRVAGIPANEHANDIDLRKGLERALLLRYRGAGVVVDETLEVREILGQSAPYLALPAGKVTLNLLKLIPETRLSLEVEKLVSEVKKSGAAARKDRVPYWADGAAEVNVEVLPLDGTSPRALQVLFEPVRGASGINRESVYAHSDLENTTLKQELADARRRLVLIIEEHHSSEEKDQNSIEEALSANEELQSLNEELETAKEELQAANEELITVNEQLRSTNAALIAARDFAMSVIETVAAPLLILDPELRIKAANPAFYRAFRTSADEAEGQLLYSISKGSWDTPRLREMLGRILPDHKSVQNFEIEQDIPGIGHRVLMLNARQLDGVQQILMGIDDATESKERDLRLAAIVESSDDAILSKTLDGTIVSWNSGAERIYGYVAKEIIGHPITTLAPQNHVEEMSPIMDRIHRGDKVRNFETKRRRKDGEIIDVSVTISPIAGRDGVVTGASIVARDITERKRAEHAIQESEALNRAILNSLPANIGVLKADGKIQAINEAWQHFAQANGDPPACVVDIGADYLEVCRRSAAEGSGDAQKALAGIQDVLAGRRPSFEMQYPCHSRAEKRWFRMIVTPLVGVVGGGAVITHINITERKQAEQRFRLAVEAAPSGMVMADRDGKIVLVNKRTEKLFGYDRNELLGQSIEILVPEPSRERHVDLRKEYFVRPRPRQMGIERDLFARRKDGTLFPVEIGLNPIETEERTWVMSSIVDITERKRAEATLRESEERFRNMADTAPVLIWVAGSDKLCTFFNRVWLEFTGRTMEQELGDGWLEGVHPDDLDRCIATYSASFDARRHFRMEYRLRRSDGEYRWVLDDGAPRFTSGGIFAGYIGSCVDITEKRRAEEERQKFVSLADRSLEFVGMCDLDFRPFYVNTAGLRLVGLDSLEAACRTKVQDCFFPEDQPFIANEFLPRVLRDGHGSVEIRFRHFKTGEAIWMLYNVFKICDAGGGTVGWATVSVNMTERRRAERSLQESRQELRALSGRLFLAQEEERKRISRELHDDLSQKVALLAFDTSSLVLAPPPSPAELKESLVNLQTRITELSTDIRQIAHQLHPSILEDLGLTAALHELCDEFSGREAFQVVFEQEAVPEALPVDVASCLYRIAQEALHNVQKHARASEVRLTVSGSPEYVYLRIQDDGVGFDSEARASPHGLGIISVKERVRHVQGEVTIHSQPGRGTTLIVSVPLPRRRNEAHASTVGG